MYAGVVVFGVVGFVATQKGVDIADVITAGPGANAINIRIFGF